MKLVVIRELEFCEYLIDRIDMVELGATVKFAGRFCNALCNLRSRVTPPNFGQRCVGIAL